MVLKQLLPFYRNIRFFYVGKSKSKPVKNFQKKKKKKKKKFVFSQKLENLKTEFSLTDIYLQWIQLKDDNLSCN